MELYQNLQVELAKYLDSEEKMAEFIVNIVKYFDEPTLPNDHFFTQIKPAITSLIQLKHSTTKEAMRQFDEFVKENNAQSEATDYAKEIMGSLIESIDNILLDYDVIPYESNEGDKFDAKVHRAIKTVKSEDSSKDKTIASSLATGYKQHNGSIVSKEHVIVYKV